LRELVTLTKSQPGKLSIGTAGIGSPPDVVARLLTHATGIDVAIIPFRTGPEGLTAVMRGDVQLFVDAPPIIAPQATAGAVKVLAVTGRAREPDLPDVQTVEEAGYPEARGEAWFGLVAPARTPPEITTLLSQEISAVLAAPEVRQRLAVLSFRPMIGDGKQFRILISDEHKRWGPIIKEAGIKLD
jgi:tripartite-type tricarboxylate transporter receptor subunit TctC